MNIFVLDYNPVKSAIYHCNKHVVKMILESATMLELAHKYNKYWYNHPCSKWVRESRLNYIWLSLMAKNLCREYSFRYNRKHVKEDLIDNLYLNVPNLPDIAMTRFALAMPEQYKSKDVVESYRNYYIGEKYKFAKWTRRKIPKWYKL